MADSDASASFSVDGFLLVRARAPLAIFYTSSGTSRRSLRHPRLTCSGGPSRTQSTTPRLEVLGVSEREEGRQACSPHVTACFCTAISAEFMQRRTKAVVSCSLYWPNSIACWVQLGRMCNCHAGLFLSPPPCLLTTFELIQCQVTSTTLMLDKGLSLAPRKSTSTR